MKKQKICKELDAAGYLQEYRRLLWERSYAKVFPFPGPTKWHPDAWVGDRAARFFAAPQEDDAPTFTWISFSGPHYPFDAPQEYYARVRADELPSRAVIQGELADEGRIQHKSFYGGGNIDGCGPAPEHACKNYTEEYWKQLQISYYANVALIDDEVGKILAEVKKCYGNDVLLIFTADHGEMLGNHGVWGKHNCGYEDVWRIPMLIQFPGQTKAAEQDGMVNLTDILPTCLDIAGAEAPACDGQSLKELDGGLLYTFGEGEGYCAVTDGRFKYIHVQKTGENYREFFDLQSDPHEFVNQINNSAIAADRARLLEKLVEHFMPKVLP